MAIPFATHEQQMRRRRERFREGYSRSLMYGKNQRSIIKAALWLGLGLLFLQALSYWKTSHGIFHSIISPQDWDGQPCGDELSRKLSETFKGRMICKDAPRFKEVCAIFNRQAQQYPEFVVQPEDAQEVVEIVKFALENDASITVKGGGHSPAGWAVDKDAILIDLGLMKNLTVDPKQQQLKAEGGAIWLDVIPEVEKHNLAFVGGECAAVGVVGVALGGGTGWLSRSYGLISDSILSLEMVLPNGTFVEISPSQNPDLLWALSGAGHANFGIVTSITYQLYHAQPRYFAGHMCFDLRSPEELRRFGQAYVNGISQITDNRLTIYTVLRRYWRKGEDFYETCYTVVFNGPLEDGKSVAQPMLDSLADALDKEVVCRRAPICNRLLESSPSQHLIAHQTKLRAGEPFIRGKTFAEIAKFYNGVEAYLYWKSGILSQMSKSAMDAMVDVIADDNISVSGSFNTVQIQINHNGGAIAMKPKFTSSFPYRQSGFVVGMHGFIGGTPTRETVDKDTDAAMHSWINRSYSRLRPLFDGAYSNYNDAELGTDWGKMYYGENYEKLKDMKKALRGHEMFRSPQRL